MPETRSCGHIYCTGESCWECHPELRIETNRQLAEANKAMGTILLAGLLGAALGFCKFIYSGFIGIGIVLLVLIIWAFIDKGLTESHQPNWNQAQAPVVVAPSINNAPGPMACPRDCSKEHCSQFVTSDHKRYCVWKWDFGGEKKLTYFEWYK